MYKKILLVVFILAFAVRIWGIFPGYPNYHPDESQIYTRAMLILLGQEEKLGYWGYPALAPLINAEFYSRIFIPLTFFYKFLQNPQMFSSALLNSNHFLQTYIFGQNDLNVLYWGRITSAIFGGLSVVMIYLIASRFITKRVAILAAVFLTFNARHVLGSHFALPDVINGFFILFTTFVSLNLLKEGRTRDYLWGGTASGLSMSIKLSPFALAMPMFAHLFTEKKLFSKLSLLKVAIIILTFFIILVVINVFHLFHLEDLMADLDKLDKRYVVGSFRILTFPYYYLFSSGIGPVLSSLSIFGVIIGLAKYFKKTLILSAPVFLTFFALTYYSIGGVYVRNFTSVIPTILIFSAVGAGYIFQKSKILAVILIILSVITPVREVINMDMSYSNRWNIDLVKDYLNNNSVKGKIAATPWFASYIGNNKSNFIKWDLNSEFSISELQKDGALYALVDTDITEPPTLWWMGIRGLESFFKAPKDLLLSSYVGSATKELLAFRTMDFAKPVKVPETNFYLVKLPENIRFSGEKVFEENFNKKSSWVIKGANRKNIVNSGQVFNRDCVGCLKIGQIHDSDSKDPYLLTPGVPRVFRLASGPIEIEDDWDYNVIADVWNNSTVNKDQRDGFIKVEAYKSIKDAESEKAGELIFVSERYIGEVGIKRRLEKSFFVSKGYRYLTISFQVDRNRNGDFYFDNLILEKSKSKPSEEIKYKDFPEDTIFVESIL